MRYKAAIFDFDGTLADSADWCWLAMNEMAGEFGFKTIAPEEQDEIRGMSSAQLMKHLGLPMWKLPLVVTRMRKLAARDIRKIKLFYGVPEMLLSLKAGGIKTAIVTSNSVENVTAVLGAQSMPLLDQVSCGASLLGKAPKLKAVLKKLGIPAAESIYIGDEIRDAAAAATAGMKFGAVAWGYAHLHALVEQRPAMTFQNVEEISKELASIP